MINFTAVIFLLKKMAAGTSNPKEKKCYNMDRGGKCVIFDHKYYLPSLHLETREGTRMDSKKIEKTFSKVNFSAEICYDFTYEQIMRKMTERKFFKSYYQYSFYIFRLNINLFSFNSERRRSLQ